MRKSRLRIWICLLLAFCMVLSVGCAQKGITNEQLVLESISHIENLGLVFENIDSLYNAYIMGLVSEGDFLNELIIIRACLQIYYDSYLSDKQQFIYPGTNTETTKETIRAADSLFASAFHVIDYAVGEDGKPLTPNEVAYVYLAYSQTVEADLVIFLAGYYLIAVSVPEDVLAKANEAESSEGDGGGDE